MLHLEDLPAELLYKIFSFLNILEIISLQSTNKRWDHLVKQIHWNQLHRISIHIFYQRWTGYQISTFPWKVNGLLVDSGEKAVLIAKVLFKRAKLISNCSIRIENTDSAICVATLRDLLRQVPDPHKIETFSLEYTRVLSCEYGGQLRSADLLSLLSSVPHVQSLKLKVPLHPDYLHCSQVWEHSFVNLSHLRNIELMGGLDWFIRDLKGVVPRVLFGHPHALKSLSLRLNSRFSLVELCDILPIGSTFPALDKLHLTFESLSDMPDNFFDFFPQLNEITLFGTFKDFCFGSQIADSEENEHIVDEDQGEALNFKPYSQILAWMITEFLKRFAQSSENFQLLLWVVLTGSPQFTVPGALQISLQDTSRLIAEKVPNLIENLYRCDVSLPDLIQDGYLDEVMRIRCGKAISVVQFEARLQTTAANQEEHEDNVSEMRKNKPMKFFRRFLEF